MCKNLRRPLRALTSTTQNTSLMFLWLNGEIFTAKVNITTKVGLNLEWDVQVNTSGYDGQVFTYFCPYSVPLDSHIPAILSNIMHKCSNQNLLKSGFLSKCSPGLDLLNKMKPPRFIKTHLPIQLVPQGFWENKCKVNFKIMNFMLHVGL